MSVSTSFTTTPALSTATSQHLSSGAAANASSGSNGNVLTQLSSNYNGFLQMLMTQLKNQNPSSPMDANTFTQELVQFSGVEQQITTNSSLTQLIQLTQETGMVQSSAMVGHLVSVSGSDMPVQNGSGKIQFTLPASENVAISVYDSSGNLLNSSTMSGTQGLNNWSWNAKNAAGVTQPDGDYKISISNIPVSGAATSIAFNAVGIVTGVTSTNGTLNVQMGAVTDPISNVQSVLN
jgi:flagellar basal-body rod modification protein FlgD